MISLIGIMYEDYKFWQVPALYYNLIYLLRRFLLIYILFLPFLRAHVALQIILLVYTQFASTIYVYKYKPFIGKL